MPQQSLFGPSFDSNGSDSDRRRGQLELDQIASRSAEVSLAALSADEEEGRTSAQEERRYRRILARKEKLGDLFGMAACYIHLGDLFLARGESEQAGDLYRKSLRLARAANNAQKKLSPDDLT